MGTEGRPEMGNVLVIDDNDAMHQLYRVALKQTGFRRAMKGQTTLEEVMTVVADQE